MFAQVRSHQRENREIRFRYVSGIVFVVNFAAGAAAATT